MKKTKWSYFICLILLPVFLMACGTSKETKQHAEIVKKQVVEAEETVKKVEKEIKMALEGPEGKYLSRYSEPWPGLIKTAKIQLSNAKSAMKRANERLKRDKSKEESALKTDLRNVVSYLESGTKAARIVANKIQDFLDKKKNASQLIQRAHVDFKKIKDETLTDKNSAFAKLKMDWEEAIIKYADKESDLKKRIGVIANLLDIAKNNLDFIEKEKVKKFPDYDLIGKSSDKIHDLMASNIHSAIANLQKRVSELNYEYEKILLDMKIESHYHVLYCDYDDYSDWMGSDKQREVGRVDYQNTKTVAEHGQYNATKMPGSSTYKAEEKWEDPKYFAKYKEIVNGKEKAGDWVSISDEYYEEHFDDKGMSIESKPKGHYVSEKQVGVQPPGYSYVGNAHYGHWQSRSDGTSFWAFYGQYRFMSDMFWGPGYHVGRGDWNDYRGYRGSGERYYGRNGEFGTSGSRTRGLEKSELYKQNKQEIEKTKKQMRKERIAQRKAGKTKTKTGTTKTVRRGQDRRNKGAKRGK